MTSLLLPFLGLMVLISIGIFLKLLLDRTEGTKPEKPLYSYKRKKFFMTRAEHEFFDVLSSTVGGEYHIFPQAHLSTILDHSIPGQDWRAARAHIDRKSVDFVLCDKQCLSPLLAIELDDKTHTEERRIERDSEVERILEIAGLPILRVPNHGSFDPVDISERIQKILTKST